MILAFNLESVPDVTHYGFVSYKEPWIHFKRLTDEYLLYFIKSGELYIEENGNEYALKKGDIFILQPGFIHSGYRQACCDYYYIHFRHDISQTVLTLNEIAEIIKSKQISFLSPNFDTENRPETRCCYLPKKLSISNCNTLVYLFHMLDTLVDDYSRKHEYFNTMASAKTIELIIRVSREFVKSGIKCSQNNYPKAYIKCQTLIDYLNNEYGRKITSEDIETRFDTNYTYLNRVFQKMTGYTIMNFLNIVRIKKAAALVENTDISLSEIGYLIGVDDPYYFSKLFKKLVGISPMQYRKNSFSVKHQL